MSIPQFCEITMLVLFGCSWPFNIAKALKTKTAKGKSVVFQVLVLIGYFIGLFGKFYTYHQTGTLSYSVWFYIADILMVSMDLVLFFINSKRDKMAAQN